MSIFDSLVLKPRTTGFVRLRLMGYGAMKSEADFRMIMKSAKN